MRLICATGLALLALAGCGGGDDGAEEGSDTADLTAALPADGLQFATTDLVALREELGLPADADPAALPEEGKKPSDEQLDLFSASGASLPHVQAAAAALLDPQKDPTVRSIDHGQVTAAASANGDSGGLVVLETTQPFDEIAAALEDESYSQDGDVWTPEDDQEPSASGAPWLVADGGDGQVLVAPERAPLDTALAGDSGASAPRDALEEVSGSARFASSLEGGDSCLEWIAGGENAATNEGEIVVKPLEAPDLARTAGAKDTDGVSIDEPEIDGDLVRFPFTAEGDAPGLGMTRLATSLAVADFYDCPG